MGHIAKIVVNVYESDDEVDTHVTVPEGDLSRPEILGCLLMVQEKSLSGAADEAKVADLAQALDAWVLEMMGNEGYEPVDVVAALTQVQLATLTGEPVTEEFSATSTVVATA